jgi:hypothetical protein
MPPSDLRLKLGKVVGAQSFEIECSNQTSQVGFKLTGRPTWLMTWAGKVSQVGST